MSWPTSPGQVLARGEPARPLPPASASRPVTPGRPAAGLFLLPGQQQAQALTFTGPPLLPHCARAPHLQRNLLNICDRRPCGGPGETAAWKVAPRRTAPAQGQSCRARLRLLVSTDTFAVSFGLVLSS